MALGCWVTVGARDEPEELAGASHFLEHLIFKGSESRSAGRIAEEVDALGGEMNAFTSREHTAFYLRLPDSALEWGVELLGEVMGRPAFRVDEMEAERQVILEELAMSLDDPDDRVHQLLFDSLFAGHPVGREVLGSPETVGKMHRDDLVEFHRTYYAGRNMIVAAAGALDPERVAASVEEHLPGTAGPGSTGRVAPGSDVDAVVVEHRPVEQAHVALGWRALPYADPDRYALAVANHAFGDGPASRLFQEVREKRGLAYAVFSSLTSFTDSGALSLYLATGTGRLDRALEVVGDVIERFVSEGLTEHEVAVAKGYLIGSLLLGLEDSGSRMARLGANEATRGEVIPIDEHVRRVEAITADDVRRVVDRVFAGPRSLAAVGPFDGEAPAVHRFADRLGVTAG